VLFVLTLYRRHTRRCAQQNRYYRRCKCPVWVEGTTDAGQYVRRSLKLSNWERAEEKKRELEGVEEVPPSSKPQQPRVITVRDAFAAFYKDCEARNLNDATLRKYRLLRDRLSDFASLHCPSLKELNIERLRGFRSTWKDGSRAAGKKIDRLRTFFRFCIDNQWIERNQALSLKAPLVKDNPTLPFSREEMMKIIDNAGDALAFILTLRYTGMRISDAAMLRTSAVDGNRVFLYTHKTGTPVYVPLPGILTNLLQAIKPVDGYFFLRGESTRMDTCTDLWRRQLSRVFRSAKITNGHPHRFRDTFAVELLLAGVPIEHVSILLGHSSIRITERHYAPWVKKRQEKLEEEVSRAWGDVVKPRLVRG
jgi:integrase/recombinase XerD